MALPGPTRVAVVTGGASGMGRATAELLAGRGYRVAVADINAEGAGAVAEEIVSAGGWARTFELDLQRFDSISSLTEGVTAECGVPTVIANVAGWNVPERFLDNTAAWQRRMIEINLLGAIRLSHEFLSVMADAGTGGRVVNVASEAGRIGSAGDAVYGAAKGGLIAFTKALAREMARHRITVNCVCPGPTDTPMFRQGASEEIQHKLSRGIPLRRVGRASDIAATIGFLVSDATAYVTGQVVSVSGGLTMAG